MATDLSAVDDYLDLMDSQLRDLLGDLGRMDPSLLWQRPAPRKWSIGEQLDHTRRVNRCFRRLFALVYLLWLPWGWLARRRPYPTEIDDVYKRPGFPSKVGFLWPPHFTQTRPLPLDNLAALLEQEHRRMRAFIAGKRPEVLGHIWFYDPPIGRVNMIQMLRVGVYHDQHHYTQIRRTLAALSDGTPAR